MNNTTKDDLRYCAAGDYGIEADFGTREECQDWISQQVDGHPEFDEYYQIETHTKTELDAMPEGEL